MLVLNPSSRTNLEDALLSDCFYESQKKSTAEDLQYLLNDYSNIKAKYTPREGNNVF